MYFGTSSHGTPSRAKYMLCRYMDPLGEEQLPSKLQDSRYDDHCKTAQELLKELLHAQGLMEFFVESVRQVIGRLCSWFREFRGWARILHPKSQPHPQNTDWM